MYRNGIGNIWWKKNNYALLYIYLNSIEHIFLIEVLLVFLEKIEDAICAVTYAEVKAPRIKNALQLVTQANFGNLHPLWSCRVEHHKLHRGLRNECFELLRLPSS